ncbi:PEP-CTERM sorting domain-containing protein [Limnofasciculus baicalensis]|uniref:PEP-CTERM sorting domain-containing protein n=1 Tax=Limnofasciculus baicalensis BBK-W-15 TaxID=2699891 RepID=A0AAE3GVH5_9CYAN|nr:PEP-CTERM sorting domain-containing protein [Limnofasciculus baicalensis]MCP2731480.1 PEP-CTERM sorting domain-containing protein [Limnofasciculus baicalensis BBK-W-15]
MNFTKTATVLGLIAGSAMALGAMPAQALEGLFGNDGIFFEEDTLVDFWFLESNGKFKSTLSVYNADTNTTVNPFLFQEAAPGYDVPKTGDFHGTCPQTVTSPAGECHTWFTFKGGVNYSLLLNSGGNNQVYSTNALNLNSQNPLMQQAEFTAMGNHIYQIAWDDTGNNNDGDMNDFFVKAEIKKAVPEPAALAGLGLVAGTMTLVRRRKNNKGA